MGKSPGGPQGRVYQLQKRDVSGTTGYIACVPGNCGLAEAVADLLAHPLDIHLHKYALEKLDPENARRLLPCLEEPGPERLVIAALLRESLFLHPEWRDIFPSLEEAFPDIEELCRHTPLPLLWRIKISTPERERLARAFRANLEKGAGVPPEVLRSQTRLPDVKSGESVRNALAEARPEAREMPEAPAVSAGIFWREVEEVLARNGLASHPEMRHESSLSPIALLREWPVSGRFPGNGIGGLTGGLTAYGRGLSLAQARASLRMEIIERASSLPAFVQKGEFLAVADTPAPIFLEKASIAELEKAGRAFHAPCPACLLEKYHSVPFYWFPAVSPSGAEALTPAQAVFLFTNLGEPAIFDAAGSSGLGAGQSQAQARLAALLELVERDAAAVTPISMDELALVRSEDEVLQGLLEDYRGRGIFPVFQNIGTEIGVPVWRCLVFGPDGIPAQATAAAMSGKAALLSALTETPWPYSWATPPPYGKKSRRPPPDLPVLTLEALPDYTMKNNVSNLLLLEEALKRLGLEPLYCDIGRTSLKYPVCRAFIPGLETHAEFDALRQPSERLLLAARRKFFPLD